MSKIVIPLFSLLFFIFYTILSWILFFRDERAIQVIGEKFYPSVASNLSYIRHVLVVLKLNSIPTAVYMGIVLIMFLLYFLSLNINYKPKKIVMISILFQIIVFFSYPILSTDVFSYVLSDRISVKYHQNVWTTRPDEFSRDPFFGLSDWTDMTRIYGGVNQVIYNVATQLSGDDLIVNIASHKLVILVFSISTIMLTWRILKSYFPENLSRGLIMVFWNPLYVVETVGSGHNDILMLFFVILSIWCVIKNKSILAGIFLSLATQVKSTPLLMALFIIAYFFSKRKFAELIRFTISYTIVILSIYFLMGVNLATVFARTSGSVNVFWQSLPMIINSSFPILKPVLTPVLGIFVFIQLISVAFFGRNYITAFCETLLIYLLFFLSAFWNWYPIWILCLLPFINGSRVVRPVLVFTLTSLLVYGVYWISLRLNYRFYLWPFIMYLTILSGPLLGMIYEKFHQKS